MRTLMDDPVSNDVGDGFDAPEHILEEQSQAASPPIAAATPVINDNVYLAYVSVHMPRLNFKVRGAAVEVNGVALNKSQATEPQWKLLPDEHKKALQRFELEKTRICTRYNIPVRTRSSVVGETTQTPYELAEQVAAAADNDASPRPTEHTFYLKGCYLIPESRLDDFVEEMDQLNTDLRDYVRTEIAADMERFRHSVRMQLNDDEAYEEARRHIPNAEELLSKTCIDWTPIPISLGSNRDARDTNMSELRRKAIERRDEFIEGVMDSLFSEPRAELVQAIAAFEDVIKRDGQVTTKCLQPIRRAIEKFRSFEDMGDSEFDGLIRDLESRFTPGNLEQLRLARGTERDSAQNAAERNGLATALRGVREQAQQDTESFQQQFQQQGRMSRGVSFGADSNRD